MSDEMKVEAVLDFKVGDSPRQANQLVDAITKIEPATVKSVAALDRLEKQAVRAAKAAQQTAAAVKNLAAENARLNRENAKLLGSQGLTSGVNGSRRDVATGRFVSPTNLAASRNAQNLAYSSYAPNIAATQAREADLRLIEKQNNSLSNQRYALYDVARTWTVVSAAILGTAGAVAKLSIDYQRNFANVARTTGVVGRAAQDLKRDLVDLTTSIPENFAQITEIAALGGQLNIAASGIEDFTSVTARLTATTNLTAEAAGTALGRFQALLNVPSSEFENLASSILKVGVNSVATETQIVNIATQISSMGDLAGFSADQVIGLSGALASVGGQPELSRGTITRTFSLMSRAIAEGGDKLQKFAEASGVSAQEFASSWGSEKFAGIFQQFLANLGTDGNAAIGILRELGITSVRDVPLLLRLAGATDVVTDAFADAEEGYNKATELGDQYAVIAETVSAKLTVLGNTIKAIADAVGGESLGPLSDLLDIVQNIAEAMLVLSRNQIAQYFLGTAGAVAVLVGALMGYRALQALTLASMYAMKTAHLELSAVGTQNQITLRGLTGTLAANAIGLQRASAAQVAYNLALDQGRGKVAAFAAGVRGATTATNGLATAGKIASRAFVWTTILASGIALLSDHIGKTQEAAEAVDRYTASINQNTAAITGNTRADITAMVWDEGIAQKANALGFSIREITDAILGEGDALQRITADYQAIEDELTAMLEAAGGTPDVSDPEWQRLSDLAYEYGQVLNFIGFESDALAEAQERQRAIIEAGGVTAEEVTEDFEGLTDALKEQADVAFEAVNADIALQESLYGLGQSLTENGTSFSAFSAGGRANMEALQKTISAMVSSSAGDSTMLASLLAGLMQQLSGYGVDAVNELAMVQSMIAQLAGGKALYNVDSLLTGFGDGVVAGNEKIAKSSRSAAKEVRTLTDYVKDLEGVFKAAFEFRFGLDNSLDAVADAWQNLRDNADEAAEGVRDALQAIREADAEIRGLNAAQTILEYQLRVAQEYGDTLRANEILAEMADNQAKLSKVENERTDSQKDLRKAQDAASKSLDGGTEASREQRSLVQSLLQAYADQVSALANTGLSQAQLAQKTAELKRQFVDQLRQLGYNEASVLRYAESFDDLTYAISKVPRNITLAADVNPAVRAVNEYLSSLNAVRGAVDGINNTPISPRMDDSQMAKMARGQAIMATIMRLQSTIANTQLLDGSMRRALEQQIQRLADKLNSGNFYTGGYTGRGGKYQVAGVVHAGEYVIPKEHVDQRTGLPYANALNSISSVMHSTNNYYNGGYVTPNSPAVQLVELLPNQIRQLADALYVRIELDGKELASSVNKANYGSATRGNN